MRRLGCYDCGLPYGSLAWADFVVADDVWAQLTEIDGANLLCARCMILRATLLGITAEGRFTSGPFADHNWKKPALSTPPTKSRDATPGNPAGQEAPAIPADNMGDS